MPFGLNSCHRALNASALDSNSAIFARITPLRFSFCISRFVSICPSFVERFSHSESNEEKSIAAAMCAPVPPDCFRSFARSPTCHRNFDMRPENSAISFCASIRKFPISSTVCAFVSSTILPDAMNASISSFERRTFRCKHPDSASCSSFICFSTADLSGMHEIV